MDLSSWFRLISFDSCAVLFCDVEEPGQHVELSAAEVVGAKSKNSSILTHRQVSEQISQFVQNESQSDDNVQPSESGVGDNHQKSRVRDRITCPVRDCHTKVIHLPRHLQNVHKYNKERAVSIAQESHIRKISRKPSLEKPKHKDYHHYRKCPITSCSALVKRLPQHLMTVHSIPGKSELLKKLLRKARMQTRQLKVAADSESYASGDNTDSSCLLTVKKASSRKHAALRDDIEDDMDHCTLLKAKKTDLENNELELDLDRDSETDSNKSLCLMKEEEQDCGDDYSFAANVNDDTEILANEKDDSKSLMHSHNATATVSTCRFDDWKKFEKWMISADGGRMAAKSAKQHSSQVKAVLCAINKQQVISSLWNKSLLMTFFQCYAS